jgi:hypothetical protein
VQKTPVKAQAGGADTVWTETKSKYGEGDDLDYVYIGERSRAGSSINSALVVSDSSDEVSDADASVPVHRQGVHTPVAESPAAGRGTYTPSVRNSASPAGPAPARSPAQPYTPVAATPTPPKARSGAVYGSAKKGSASNVGSAKK